MNILLVDDESQISEILSETLTVAGFDVHACNGGEAALDWLENHQPEVMLTDLRMPGLSGLELARVVNERYPDIQMVILTGFGDMDSAIEALRLGAYDYLSKPVDAERLVHTIQNGAERRRLIIENRNLIDNLREANRIKTEFLHGMSHEVRTPLGHITGFSEILEQTMENINDRQSRYLNNIQKAAKKLLQMFDDILQYSDLNSGEIDLNQKPISLSRLTEQVQKPFIDPIQHKQLHINTSLPSPEATVLADEELLAKILEVIFQNAVQFSPEGGDISIAANLQSTPDLSGTLSDRLPKSDADAYLHLSISDQGQGIAEADQKRIFNLFEQVDGSLTREHEGTGLGLSLAQSLARQHGGVVTLQSAPDEGSTFTIVIPVEAS